MKNDNEPIKRLRMSKDDMAEAVRLWRENDPGLEQYLKDHGINHIGKWKQNQKLRYGKSVSAATVNVDGPIRIQTKEPEKVEIVETDDEQHFDERCTTTAIRVEGLGEFYFDKKYNSIDWRTEGGDEVSLGPAWWRQLIDDLPRIMKKLGVEM